MAEKTFLLGVDVGTTGCKAVLVRGDGVVAGEATEEHPLSTPRPLWAEQDPEDWWRGTVASCRAVLDRAGVSPGAVAGIGLTGQMHGLVLLDRRGDVLRPCILWNDQRTAAQCAAITERVGAGRVLEITGSPVLPGFTAPKIEWVRENEPAVFARIARVLLPKDFVRYRLTGVSATDVSDASGTSLLDVARRRWSEEMLAALEVPRSWLPEVAESPVVSGHLAAAAAEATGLPAGIPVVAGAGDQAAQAVGCGVVSNGDAAVTLGTSGVVFAACREYRPEPEGRLHAFCHAVPGMWHLMGVMLSAGGSLRWYRDTIGEPERARAAAEGRDPYEVLIASAATVPAGCEGLMFLPYLTGERTPHADPYARGVFFGLTVRHGRPHLTRAVLEGVTYGLRDSLELMRQLGLSVTRIRASGGGARSDVWLQMLADVFGCEVVTVGSGQGAACGAALLAGVGAGVFPGVVEAARAAVDLTGSRTPGPDATVYADFHPRYRALYPALAGEFARVAGLVGPRAGAGTGAGRA